MRLKTRTVAVAMTAAFVSACGIPEARKYDAGDNPRFSRERYECERDARSINATNCTQMDLYDTCMLSKGYKPIPGTGSRGVCGQLFEPER